MKDPVAQKFFRISAYELTFLKTLDGTLPIEAAIQHLKLQGYYYSLEDAKTILGKAAQSGLVLGTLFGTAEYQKSLKQRIKSAETAKKFSSVYFLFIPLLNPDWFLKKTLPIFKILANKWTGLSVLLAAPGALYLLISGLPKIEFEYLFFFNWENLLYLWVTLAVTKLIHEFSHAYTAKSFGLHVPQMGLAFLIFFPCLYCNTTEAWQLADRRQRMAISAAGIAAEGVVAVICTYIWYFSAPGLLNSLAFYLMAISFVSTVLFNGNPLLKYDGYFILIDLLRIPNLASKSTLHIKYLFMNRVLGLTTVPKIARDSREQIIFTSYGISAFIYRIFLYAGICIGVYYRFDKVAGIFLAILAFGLFVIRPIAKGIMGLIQKRSEIRPRFAGTLVFVGLVGLIAAVLLFPTTNKSIYLCYITSAKSQKLAVPLQTMVSDVFVREGSKVPQGQMLFRLETSPLELSLHKKDFQKNILMRELALWQIDQKRMSEAGKKEIELVQALEDIRFLKRELRRARTDNIAPFEGVITKLDPRMQEGFQPGEGVIVGELQSWNECVIHALVPGQDIHLINRDQDVVIWFPLDSGIQLERKIDKVKTFSESDLKDSPFSSRIGGQVATEMKGEHHKDVPLEDFYVCSSYFDNKISLPLGMTGKYVVSSPPKSIVSRFIDNVFRTFNNESVL